MTPTAAAHHCSQDGSRVEGQDDEGQLPLRATARGVETERQAMTQHLQLCENHDNQGKARTRMAITTITTTTTGPPTAVASNCSQGGNGEQEGQG